MKNRIYGIGLSFGLTMIFLMIFFGKILKDPNNYYFATTGDGLKAYYVALYHVRYDPGNFVSTGMNYPFGELYTYTDGQLPVVSVIRFISAHLFDIRDYTVAILNLLMLLSILAGALFICLILLETGVSWWYSALASVGIAILSPQIGRLGGHFSLSWILWIPLMIWLIIRFDRNRNLALSLLIGLTTWIAGMMHFYYLGFYGFLTGGYWFFRFVRYKQTQTRWYRDLLHFSVQYIIPVLLLQLFVVIHDGVSDRPGYPFGYQSSIAHPVGVFFPSGFPWGFVRHYLTVFNHISWESYSYIGTAALAGLLAGLVLSIRRRIKKEPFININESRTVQVLFWASVAALLFSFGIPFVFGMRGWFSGFAQIRQLRVLARFAWLFYYLLNIVIFSGLYRKAFNNGHSIPWKILATAGMLLLWFEGACNLHGIAPQLLNRLPETGSSVPSKQNRQTAGGFQWQSYQAVIPLPFFHIGSENIWTDGSDESKKTTLLTSLETGLPTTAAILSRTSISQTFLLDALVREPLQRLELVDFLTDDRPFLIMKMKGYEPSDPEKRLLSEVMKVGGNDQYTLYSISVNTLKSIHEIRRREILSRYDSLKLFTRNGFRLSDSAGYFRLYSFNGFPSAESLMGRGAFSFTGRTWNLVVSDTLSGTGSGRKINIGFWLYPYQKDGSVRSQIRIIHRKAGTQGIPSGEQSDLFRNIRSYLGDWALIELETETRFKDEILEISVRNTVIPSSTLVLDELLIRDKNLDVWQSVGRFVLYNDRKFQRR
jgi:hypothetical protein